MVNIEDAIKAINPDAEFRCKPANSTSGITWLNGTSPITIADIEAKQAELQAEFNAKEYQTKRKEEYPEIGDQLDMLWHSIDQDASLKQKYFAFHQAILAVKSKYPKK